MLAVGERSGDHATSRQVTWLEEAIVISPTVMDCTVNDNMRMHMRGVYYWPIKINSIINNIDHTNAYNFIM